MPKLIDLFKVRENELYDYTKSPYRKEGDEQPYIYTTLQKANPMNPFTEDQSNPLSLSARRDISRIFEFSKKNVLFLGKQQLLQSSNTFAQTRLYNPLNLQIHSIPFVHKSRHLNIKQTIESILGSGDIYEKYARLQEETVDSLTSDSGTALTRARSRYGILYSDATNNIGVTIKQRIRNVAINFLNKIFSPINGTLTGIRAQYTNPTSAERPETLVDYYDKMVSVGHGNYGITYHVYDYNQHQYVELLKTDRAIGAIEAKRWSEPSPYSSLIPNYDEEHKRLDRIIPDPETRTQFGNSFGGRVGRNALSTGQSLFKDLQIFKTFDRIKQDVKNFKKKIDEVRKFIKNIKSGDIFAIDINAKNSILGIYRNSEIQTVVDKGVEVGQERLNKFIDEAAKFKGTTKPISIAKPSTDGTKFIKESWKTAYYKDDLQINEDIFTNQEGIKDYTDFIDVLFKTDTKVVRFRSFIEDISENITPSYNENKYLGRYETFYTYNKVIRDLSFKLTLQAFSSLELNHILQKMSYLTSLSYPENTSGYLTPTIVNITVGKLYNNQPCLVYSISHTIENDASWDIDSELPTRIIANIKLRLLDKTEYTSTAKNIYIEGATGGLIPRTPTLPFNSDLLYDPNINIKLNLQEPPPLPRP